MKFVILSILAVMIGLIVFLSIFLQPNDMKKCDESPSAVAGCQKADAIIAVSGGDTNQRTQYAIDLYKKGWANYIIFSGASADKDSISNAEAMRRYALARGVPDTAIFTEDFSQNTHENATKTQKILEAHDIQDIILTTSGYHQRRVYAEFTVITKDENVMIRNAPTADRDWSWWWWLSPSGWYLAVSELVKVIIFYTGATP